MEVADMLADNPKRVVVDVDERGRVSLARFGIRDMQTVVGELVAGNGEGMAFHVRVSIQRP